MADVVRVSVSLEADLLARFDEFCAAGQSATRSEAVRQLIHEKLTAAAFTADATDVAASLTLVYDHHRPGLTDALVATQHAHGECVVATLHVHLDHDLCMEVVALRGPAGRLRHLAAALTGLKGVRQAQLVVILAEPGGHPHPHPHPH